MDRVWSIGNDPKKVPTLTASLPSLDHSLNLLFLGDLHWDNAHCLRKELKYVLDQAIARDAAIVLLGDTLDLMQGRDDRRSAKSVLRNEHARDDYFSAVIETFCDWWEPYAGNTWIALEGNHESAARKHHELDVTRLWTRQLNAKGASIIYPGYSTYARIQVTSHTRRYKLPFFIHHGSNGGGPITKNTIPASRRALMYPDAHFLVTGHTHVQDMSPNTQYRIGHDGRPYKTTQKHYGVGVWKDEYGDGEGGFHVERGRGPTQAGGWWLEITANSHRGLRWSFAEALP